MNILRKIFSAIILSGCLVACTDSWDSHFSQQEEVIDNSEISVAQTTATDYLKSEKSLSSMYALFEEAGVVKTMDERDQVYTILVADNEAIAADTSTPTDDKDYLAKSHVSDVSLSPANLTDGQRVLMWNGKYLNVSKIKDENGHIIIAFNGTKVKKIVKVNNGFIYILKSYVSSPKSMYEMIEDLGSDYSMFREMIMSRNKKVFDKNASMPIGVDNTGSTVYDSVFVVTNPYFVAKKFDLMSESLMATMLIPSNEVITEALNAAKQSLKEWNMTRADSVLENWIFQAVFFNQKYTKLDFANNIDITSVFDKQWRTTIQQVDVEHPVQMSNGVAYHITWMKIPTNVLIYRLKDYFKWYEYLSADDKASYFASENLVFEKCETKVTAWSGWPAGGFPEIENRVLRYKLENTAVQEYTLNFTPLKYKANGAGSYTAAPYMIPPGEYDLCLGFEQKLGHDVEISFDKDYVSTITASQLTSTTFHYDRGGQGYPEGYDLSKATNSKKSNYDRDGGKIGEVTISGTQARSILITLKGKKVTNGKTCFHHWCLRPTKNCY
nr:fasciclin domain-containing protein [uncultured Bacteroides sp.]